MRRKKDLKIEVLLLDRVRSRERLHLSALLPSTPLFYLFTTYLMNPYYTSASILDVDKNTNTNPLAAYRDNKYSNNYVI